MHDEVVRRAKQGAHAVAGCVGVAMHPEQGVEWYNEAAMDEMGQLEEAAGWTTWIDQDALKVMQGETGLSLVSPTHFEAGSRLTSIHPS